MEERLARTLGDVRFQRLKSDVRSQESSRSSSHSTSALSVESVVGPWLDSQLAAPQQSTPSVTAHSRAIDPPHVDDPESEGLPGRKLSATSQRSLASNSPPRHRSHNEAVEHPGQPYGSQHGDQHAAIPNEVQKRQSHDLLVEKDGFRPPEGKTDMRSNADTIHTLWVPRAAGVPDPPPQPGLHVPGAFIGDDVGLIMAPGPPEAVSQPSLPVVTASESVLTPAPAHSTAGSAHRPLADKMVRTTPNSINAELTHTRGSPLTTEAARIVVRPTSTLEPTSPALLRGEVLGIHKLAADDSTSSGRTTLKMLAKGVISLILLAVLAVLLAAYHFGTVPALVYSSRIENVAGIHEHLLREVAKQLGDESAAARSRIVSLCGVDHIRCMSGLQHTNMQDLQKRQHSGACPTFDCASEILPFHELHTQSLGHALDNVQHSLIDLLQGDNAEIDAYHDLLNWTSRFPYNYIPHPHLPFPSLPIRLVHHLSAFILPPLISVPVLKKFAENHVAKQAYLTGLIHRGNDIYTIQLNRRSTTNACIQTILAVIDVFEAVGISYYRHPQLRCYMDCVLPSACRGWDWRHRPDEQCLACLDRDWRAGDAASTWLSNDTFADNKPASLMLSFIERATVELQHEQSWGALQASDPSKVEIVARRMDPYARDVRRVFIQEKLQVFKVWRDLLGMA